MKFFSSFVFFCFATVVLSSCNHESPKENVLHHDLDRPFNDRFPFQWLALSREAFLEHTALFYGVTIESLKVLPSDHPATLHAQAWVDKIDAVFAARHPEMKARIPAPKVIVRNDIEANAFVSNLPVCLALPIRFSLAPSEQEEEVQSLTFNRSKGNLTQDERANRSCVPSSLTLSEQKKLVAFWFQPFSKCEVTVDEKGILAKEGCRSLRDASSKKVTAAKKLILYQPAQWITIYTGAHLALGEDAFIGMIAHELSHYYMSHQVTPGDSYNYFYELKAESETRKPVPDHTLEAFGKEVVETAKLRGKTGFYWPVEGQEFHSYLFKLTRQLFRNFDEKQCNKGKACIEACTHLSAFIVDGTKMNGLSGFPFQPVSPNALPSYFGYEEALTGCLRKLPQSPSTNPSLMERTMKETLSRAGFTIDWESLPRGETSLLLWQSLSKLLTEITTSRETQMNAVLRKAVDKHLGYYTYEQEADELAAEFLWRLDLKPHALISQMFAFSSAPDNDNNRRPPLYGTITHEACLALEQRGWRDEAGNRVIVPVGDYADTHHSFCFRAYNVSREIIAHGYRDGEDPKPVLSHMNWEALQNLLREGL